MGENKNNKLRCFWQQKFSKSTDLLGITIDAISIQDSSTKAKRSSKGRAMLDYSKTKKLEVFKMWVFFQASEVHGDVWRDPSSPIRIKLYFATSCDTAVIDGIIAISTFESHTIHCCIASWVTKSWEAQRMNGILSFPSSGVSKVRKSWNLCLVNLPVFSAICFDISYVLLVRPNHPNTNHQHQHAVFAVSNSQLCWYRCHVAWGCASVFPWRFSSDCPADTLPLLVHHVTPNLASF